MTDTPADTGAPFLTADQLIERDLIALLNEEREQSRNQSLIALLTTSPSATLAGNGLIVDKEPDPPYILLLRCASMLTKDIWRCRFIASVASLLADAVATEGATPSRDDLSWPCQLLSLASAFVADNILQSHDRDYLRERVLASVDNCRMVLAPSSGLTTKALELAVELRAYLPADYWLSFANCSDIARNYIVLEGLCLHHIERAFAWSEARVRQGDLAIIDGLLYLLPGLLSDWRRTDLEPRMRALARLIPSAEGRLRVDVVWQELGFGPLSRRRQGRRNRLARQGQHSGGAGAGDVLRNGLWLRSASELQSAVQEVRSVRDDEDRLRIAMGCAEIGRARLAEMHAGIRDTEIAAYFDHDIADFCNNHLELPIEQGVQLALVASEPRFWLDESVFTQIRLPRPDSGKVNSVRLRRDMVFNDQRWDNLYAEMRQRLSKYRAMPFNYRVLQLCEAADLVGST